MKVPRNLKSLQNFQKVKFYSNTNVFKEGTIDNSPGNSKKAIAKVTSRNNSISKKLKKVTSRNKIPQKINSFIY